MKRQIVDDFKADVLSGYCISGCNEDCCIFGPEQIFAALELTEPQLEMIVGSFPLDDNVISRKNGCYELFNTACPRYDRNSRLCTAYTHPLRPDACRSFPLDTDGEVLNLDSRCPFIWHNWEHVTQSFRPWFEDYQIDIIIPTELAFQPISLELGYHFIKQTLNHRFYKESW